MSQVPVEVEWVQARQARARWAGGRLCVRLPRHWPEAQREEALAKFRRWAEARRLEEGRLDAAWRTEAALGPGRAWGSLALAQEVRRVNEATLQAPLKGVRLGQAKRSRLAQCNPKTGILTFSRHAVDHLPSRALRYLILHELAHLFEANHSPRFWALVARHEPDWKRLRQLTQHHHHRAVGAQEGGPPWPPQPALAPVGRTAGPSAPPAKAPSPPPAPGGACGPGAGGAHPFGPLYAFVPSPWAGGRAEEAGA